MFALNFYTHPTTQSVELLPISTLLDPHAWADALSAHPDQICLQRPALRRQDRISALLSLEVYNCKYAISEPSSGEVVSGYIQKELSLSRMLGPFHST